MSQEKIPTEKIGGRHRGVHAVNLRNERFDRVQWFLTNLIPKAELTLLNGDGGLGKTTAILDLLARASSGQKMPCGLQHAPMKVLILAEEDRRGLVRARLDAARANHDNIRLIDSTFDIREEDGEELREYFTFPKHAKHLYEAITAGGFEVVFIDAIANHYDGDIKATQPQEMRRAYRPISETAHEAPAVIIAARHITKGAGPASMRGNGSLEARNLCRSELTVGMHPDREEYPGLRMIALSKANLSSNSEATAAFNIEPFPWKDDQGEETTVPVVRWSNAPPRVHADELVNVPEPKRRLPVNDAVDFLKRALAAGKAKPLQELVALGLEEGLEEHHLQRARQKVPVYFGTEGRTSYWALTQKAVDEARHLAREASHLARVQKSRRSVKSVIDDVETRAGAAAPGGGSLTTHHTSHTSDSKGEVLQITGETPQNGTQPASIFNEIPTVVHIDEPRPRSEHCDCPGDAERVRDASHLRTCTGTCCHCFGCGRSRRDRRAA